MDDQPATGAASDGDGHLPALTPFTPDASGPVVFAGPAAQAVRGPSRKSLGVVLSVFALICASGFAVITANASDGASTPEAAVQQLFDAIESNDIIGLVEVLPPSERAAIGDPFRDVIGELQRLEILGDFDQSQVPGFEFDVEGLELASTELGSEVSAVQVTGGTITSTVRPEDLPLGDTVRSLMEEDMAEEDMSEETETTDLADEDFELVTIREGGGWHVSLFYSVAEAVREDDSPMPDFGGGLTPVGADTPEGAVRGLIESAADLDLGAVISMLPPDEMRVLYDYGPLFVDEADEAAAEVRADGFSVELDSLELHAEGGGDARTVTVDALDVTMGDDETSVHLALSDTCIDMEMTYQTYSGDRSTFMLGSPTYYGIDGEQVLDGDVVSEFGAPSDPSGDGETVTDTVHWCDGDEPLINGEQIDEDEWGFSGDMFGTGAGAFTSFALRVVQVDGTWYVSPTRSLFEPMLEVLQGLDAAELEEMIDGFFGGFMSGATSEFTEVGGSIDDGCFALYDEVGSDATDEEWAEVDAAVNACMGMDPESGMAPDEVDGGIDGPIDSDELLSGMGPEMDALAACSEEAMAEDELSTSVASEMYDCLVAHSDGGPDHPVLVCFDEFLALGDDLTAEEKADAAAAMAVCFEEQMSEFIDDPFAVVPGETNEPGDPGDPGEQGDPGTEEGDETGTTVFESVGTPVPSTSDSPEVLQSTPTTSP